MSGGFQSRIWISAWIAFAFAFAAASCGGDYVIESKPSAGFEESGVDPLQPLLELSENAPWTTLYQGTRRIEARYFDGTQETVLSYRETVAADGAGNFAVETVELLSFLTDPTLFLVTQDLREGFLYRYRDFAVRDLDAFYQSHVAYDLASEILIAGRTCQEIQVESADQSGTTFRVALDVETGLVLRSIELDAAGVEIQRMEFETYDAAPDLSGVVWFQPALPETALNLHGDLSAQVGFEVLQPTLLPDGYRAWKAATLVDESGATWVKQTFTDGIDPLFFFHDDGTQPVVPGAGASAAATTATLHDDLYVYSIGSITVIEGRLRGRSVIALGKVDSDAMLDMIESAID